MWCATMSCRSRAIRARSSQHHPPRLLLRADPLPARPARAGSGPAGRPARPATATPQTPTTQPIRPVAGHAPGEQPDGEQPGARAPGPPAPRAHREQQREHHQAVHHAATARGRPSAIGRRFGSSERRSRPRCAQPVSGRVRRSARAAGRPAAPTNGVEADADPLDVVHRAAGAERDGPELPRAATHTTADSATRRRAPLPSGSREPAAQPAAAAPRTSTRQLPRTPAAAASGGGAEAAGARGRRMSRG